MVLDREEEPQDIAEDEPDEVDEEDLEDASAADAALGPDDDDSEETSLDELLSQRAAARRSANEPEEDTEDIMALTSEKESPSVDALPTRVIPVKERQEFVCSNCHLVKARSQLADPDRMLCRDCA